MISKFLLVGVPLQTRKYIRGSAMTKRLESIVLHSTRALISKKKKHRVVRNNKLKRSR